MNNIRNGLLEAERLMRYEGFKLIESFGVVEPGDLVKERKTLKERFFKKPWNPFNSYKIIIPMVPIEQCLVDTKNNLIVAYPDIIKKIKEKFK